MSRSRRPRRNEHDEPVFVTPTVAEAERLLEEARRAEAEREAELARQAEDELRRRTEYERDAAALANAIESRVKSVVAEVADANVCPTRDVRTLARAWLHGAGASYGDDFMNREQMLAAKDGTAALLLDTTAEAGDAHEQITNLDGPFSFPVDHPVARRIDAAEVIAWRAFVSYIRALAGE